MKPRARRITIGAAALVAVLVAVLVLANWGTVRDHVEAWHFQLTRATRTIEPDTKRTGSQYSEEHMLHVAANELRSPVIVDPKQLSPIHVELTPETICATLKRKGWRFLEQHFPRRAYVVIRAVDPVVLIEAELRAELRAFPQQWNTRWGTAAPAAGQPIQWDGVYPRPERDPDSDIPVKRFGLEVR